MENKLPTVKVSGKDYVMVKDRLLAFNENFPNGSIMTELLSELNDEMVVVKAIVMPDAEKPIRFFTGYSQATWGDGYINKTAALENCETSAVGRALAFMGIGVIESVASAEEVVKAQTQRPFNNEKARKMEIKTIARDEAEHDAGNQ